MSELPKTALLDGREVEVSRQEDDPPREYAAVHRDFLSSWSRIKPRALGYARRELAGAGWPAPADDAAFVPFSLALEEWDEEVAVSVAFLVPESFGSDPAYPEKAEDLYVEVTLIGGEPVDGQIRSLEGG